MPDARTRMRSKDPSGPQGERTPPDELAEQKLRRVLTQLNLVEVLQHELLKSQGAADGPPSPAVRRLLAELGAARAELEALGCPLQPLHGSLAELYEAELERERRPHRRGSRPSG